jgi:cysteine-rich secretory family protein
MKRNFLPRFFLALIVFSTVLAANVFSQRAPDGDEKYLFDAANRERTSQNLRALKWDASLADAARTHLRKMVEARQLSHQFSGEADLSKRLREAGAHFSMVAENIALAPNVDELHIGWMNSIPHRENILNPKLTAIGIAVEKRGEEFFAVQDFSLAVEDLSKEGQEKRVGELLHAQGLKISASSEDARKACDGAPGNSGARPNAILHFEASDLNELPEQVVRTVRKSAYRSASVGACNAVESRGFSLFRIAILLY